MEYICGDCSRIAWSGGSIEELEEHQRKVHIQHCHACGHEKWLHVRQEFADGTYRDCRLDDCMCQRFTYDID